MKPITIIALAAFLPASLAAADLPTYDVDAYCDRIMNLSGGSASIRNGCIDNEQAAYDSLKNQWGSLPDQTASYCHRLGELAGGSYSIAQGCVANETGAAGNPKTFRR